MPSRPYAHRLRCARIGVASLLFALCVSTVALGADEVETDETILRKLRVPADLKLDLVAREPQLRNPVAFSIDERGRFFVAETYRLHEGVTDIRGHMDWLDDDLASRTVADQEALLRRHLGKKAEKYTVAADRVQLLEDRDGDGRVDHSVTFADGFRGLVAGIGAGVLARDGNVWYTNIPSLWLLRDRDDDGVAEDRQALQTGYGVHISFIGHDLHGLTIGPDGRLYFSNGDRGMHVEHDGRTFAYPDEGTVMRCNLDGSELEVFARGLRNPQELAFDDYGNLWTGDNNSDGGDLARLVYLVEGSDSGWRIGYQTLEGRGPWNAERLWHPEDAAASQLPPIRNLGHGPSGLVYYPGTGLPERYKGHFFLSNFPGNVLAFTVRPKGASFELVSQEKFVENIYSTDVEFGPDGGIYILDWVYGWDMPQKGRIFRLTDPQVQASKLVAETRTLLRGTMREHSTEKLVALLDHADRRVRLNAQFELARRASDSSQGESVRGALTGVATGGESVIPRLHAIWALGQVARASGSGVLEPLVALLRDGGAPEVRCQAARVLGEARHGAALEPLVKLLDSGGPREQFFACMALGKLGDARAIPAIMAFARTAADDPYLRHACVMALAGTGDSDAIAQAARSDSPGVRLVALLVMRRAGDANIAQFLEDTDPRIVLEAARAINDVPIDAATPALAACLDRPISNEHALRRVLHANFRAGSPQHATALATFAATAGTTEPLRRFALELLGAWGSRVNRDQVNGAWRPIDARDPAPARKALAGVFDRLLSGSPALQLAAVRAAARLGVKDLGARLAECATERSRPADVRAEALAALSELADARLSETVQRALDDPDASVFEAAVRLVSHVELPDAIERLRKIIFSDGPIAPRQAALAVLGRSGGAQADALLSECIDRLTAGQCPPPLELDVLEAVRKYKSKPLTERVNAWQKSRPKAEADVVGAHRELLYGGDPVAGRRVFEDQKSMCVKCHAIAGQGGIVGPDLASVGAIRTREQILESLLAPNREIVPEYRTVVLFTADDSYVGRPIRETAEEMVLLDAEGNEIVVYKDEIEARREGLSAMPENVTQELSPREIRDLVAFLAEQKAPTTRPAAAHGAN